MGRVLAIDHGSKRSGLAVTDSLRIIASALDTVPTADLLDYLTSYLAREEVDGFVVGLPVGLDGRPTDATRGVETFLEQLQKAFPDKWVKTVDERFTSKLAERTVLQSGIGRMARRDKAQLDRISATILLQDWLSRKS